MEYLKEQFDIGNFGRALKESDKLLNFPEYKDDYDVLMFKALAHLNLYQEHKAIETLTKVITLYPDKQEAYNRKVNALNIIGEFDLARDCALSLLAFDKDNLEALDDLVYIEMEVQDFEKVTEYATSILLIDNSYSYMYFLRAVAYAELKQYKKAIDDINASLKLSRNNPLELSECYSLLGWSHSALGNHQLGIKEIKKAIEYNPESAEAFSSLGYVLGESGKLNEGLQYINHSLKINPDFSHTYLLKADLLEKNNEDEEALKVLFQARKVDEDLYYENEISELILKIEGKKSTTK